MKSYGKFTVGLTYKVEIPEIENGTYVVVDIEHRRSGTTFIHFKGLSGTLSKSKQAFTIDSPFSNASEKI